jgi:subtilisin family serine protease
MNIDAGYHPACLPGTRRLGGGPMSVKVFSDSVLNQPVHSVSVGPTAYAIRAEFEDDQAIEDLKNKCSETVIGAYADPTIEPFVFCQGGAVGSKDDVVQQLGLDTLHKDGVTGKNVRVAIVDTGLDHSRLSAPIIGGWSAIDPNYQPGSTTPPKHGTMCAWDVLIGAPDAQLLDYALLQSAGETLTGFLSDALKAFDQLIQLLHSAPGPLVVNNSWGLLDSSEDAPVGSEQNYSANPNHPFNQITGALVAAGADVLFAAGNCGADCPFPRCGINDRGPGKSILGASSHPDVITVAAVTVQRERLGYSSQGPGVLCASKPDVAGYCQFIGSGVFPVDAGTSAASPVIAGVVAALRQVKSVDALPPLSMKSVIERTAIDIGGKGWNTDLGYGVVDARGAYQMLKQSPVYPAPSGGSAKDFE